MIEMENHHWVPRFLIKNFADADGRVFRLDIENDQVSKRSPRMVASAPNFYKTVLADEPMSFESWFEKLETAAAPSVRYILSQGDLSGLTHKNRSALARFIAMQSIRTEAYREGLELAHQRVDHGHAIAAFIQQLPAYANLIFDRNWALLTTTAKNPFYLGDNPVVLQHTENPGKAAELGFDLDWVEAFMPLSPTKALYMPCPKTCREIHAGYLSGLTIVLQGMARGSIPEIGGKEPVSFAQKAISTSGPLYRALYYGEALVAEPENVTNLNYLQCAWASSAIYSNVGCFEFARQVFRENPQYKDVLPVKMVSKRSLA